MEDKQINIYTPGYRHKIGFFKLWGVLFKNIVSSRDLIIQLFKRDFLAVYKQSFLGIWWILIAPVLGIAQWVLMNAAGVLKPGDTGGIPYPAYVLISMAIWGMFPGFFNAAMKTLEVAKDFIMQVKFPHEALVTKQAAEYLANFMLSFTLTIIVLLFFDVTPAWQMVFLPLSVLPLFFFATGLGLLFAIPNVITKEILKITELLINLLLFVTPVVYSSKVSHPLLQSIIKWNPLTYLVGVPRDLILYGTITDQTGFIYASCMSFLVFMFSWRLFYVSEDKVIEKMI